LQLLIYPEQCAALGLRAREYALEKWTAKVQAERMIAFYQTLKPVTASTTFASQKVNAKQI
jgi:hypothetical protein